MWTCTVTHVHQLFIVYKVQRTAASTVIMYGILIQRCSILIRRQRDITAFNASPLLNQLKSIPYIQRNRDVNGGCNTRIPVIYIPVNIYKSVRSCRTDSSTFNYKVRNYFKRLWLRPTVCMGMEPDYWKANLHNLQMENSKNIPRAASQGVTYNPEDKPDFYSSGTAFTNQIMIDVKSWVRDIIGKKLGNQNILPNALSQMCKPLVVFTLQKQPLVREFGIRTN